MTNLSLRAAAAAINTLAKALRPLGLDCALVPRMWIGHGAGRFVMVRTGDGAVVAMGGAELVIGRR